MKRNFLPHLAGTVFILALAAFVIFFNDTFIQYAAALVLAFLGLGILLVLWSFLLRRQAALRARSLEMEIQERKRAADSLFQSANLLETIFNSMHTLVAYMDAEFNFLRVNQNYAASDNQTPEYFTGKNHFVLFPNAENQAIFEEVVRSGNPYTAYAKPFEYAEHPERGVSYWDWTVSPVKDGQGRVVNIVLSLVNVTEHKQMEKALRESEEWHRTVLQTAMDGFWMADLKGCLLEVNETYCRMSGYSKAELLSMSISDVEVRETAGDVAAHIQRIIEQGEDRFESRHRRKDGSSFDVGVNAQYRASDDGQLIVFVRDITVRKQADEELRESEARFHGYFELPLAGRAITSPSKGWLDVNDALCKMLGYTREELTRMTWEEITHPDDLAANLELFNRAVAGELEGYNLEKRYVHKDGHAVHVSLAVHCLRNPDGTLDCIVSQVIDTTERRQAEETSRRMMERLSIVYRAGQEISASLDTEQAFQAVYRAVGEVMPCEDFLISLYDEPRNIMWGDFIIENGMRVPSNPYQASRERGLGGYIVYTGKPVLLNSPQQISESEINFIPYGSGPVTSSVLAVPMQLKGKNIGMVSAQSYHSNAYTTEDQELLEMLAGHAAAAIDNASLFKQAQQEIAERMHAEEVVRQLNFTLEKRIEERTRQLRDAQEQLVRHEKLSVLGQMASSIGHELRNPLSLINSAIYYLKLVQPDADEKIKQYLGIIEQEVHTSEKIITDLLDFARIKSVDREVVSASDLIRQALMRFPAPPEVDVTIECPKDLPRVYADPRQMIQVLGNLTLNACQSMLAPGLNKSARVRHLSLYSSLQDDMIKIIVKDSGEGIPAENMKKIFEPLFTTKPKGVGLGLPVSQKLVEANGGRIEVQSEPGTGSTFSVYLPIYKEPQ